MIIILDSNIWVSFLLGFQREFVRRVLTDPDIAVYVCPQLLNEIKDVASRPKIQNRIQPTDLEDMLNLIAIFCHNALIHHDAVSEVRDAKDLYLLSLAETIGAEYLVSGDNDLADLQEHGTTHIVTIAEFKRRLPDL